MRKVFLIILNWNGWELTRDCLESVNKTTDYGLQSSVDGRRKTVDSLNIEIVVIDNGSTDGSVEKIKKSITGIKGTTSITSIKIIENQANLGFAGGNNVGIRYALENGADYICLLNNDTRVSHGFLEELIKVAESNNNIGIVGGKIYFEKGYEFHKDRYQKKDFGKVIWYAGGLIDWNNVYASHRGVDEVDVGQYEREEETEYVNGCLMLIKKEVFEKIGLLYKKYFLYFEENDFCQRAKKAGFKLYYAPKSIIWHLNAGSSGSGSDLHDYFLTRNRLMFGMKWAPLRSKISLIKESLGMMFSGRKWQKIGVKDFYLGNFGRGSWRA